ncbi:MAG: AAA family ATPase [Nitriliruptorales bacterium]|nr:AAA family ATPase [Nitriliruptorales bacterium]
MTTVLTPLVQRFIDATAPVLVAMDGTAAREEHLRRDAAVEAAHIVAGVIDADRMHSDDELWAYIMTFAPLFDSRLIHATPVDARKAQLLDGRRRWLEAPSPMFELLLNADRRDATSHAWAYYRNAIELAHASQALDTHLTRTELETVDAFRTMLLEAIDAAGVRPGTQAARGSRAAVDTPAAAEEVAIRPARPVQELLDELEALVGLAPVKHEVRLVTNLLQVQRLRESRGLPVVEGSRHLVFTGNPGTGKTTVARLLAEIYRSLGVVDQGQLVETDRSALVAGFVGQTAPRVRDAFDRAAGGILLIDEAYALARGGENDFGREAIDTIVKLMEDRRDAIVLIVAGYPEEMATFIGSNPGLRSRFPRTIHFPDYTDRELVEIFSSMAQAAHYRLGEGAAEALHATLSAHDRGKGFGNARVVRNLFEQAVANHASRVVGDADPSDDDLTILIAADIPPLPAP